MIFKHPKNGNKHFGSLLKYLCQEQKMSWMETYNLAELEPENIAKEMEFTAGMSSRCKTPLYHRMLSWDPGDHPTPEQMKDVGARFLNRIGLEEYEAVIIAHNDRRHPHLHFVVNRVHPESTLAWENYEYSGEGRDRKIVKKEYQRLEEFARSMEKEFGWRQVPGKHTDHGKKVQFDGRAPEIWELKRETEKKEAAAGFGYDPEKVDLRPPKLKAKALKEFLFEAKSFEKFDEILAYHDMWLEKRGQGLVITDGKDPVAASHVSRAFSKKNLEKRFNDHFDRYDKERERGIHSEIGDRMVRKALAIQAQEELETVKNITKKAIKRIETELALIDSSPEVQQLKKKIDEGFSRVYKNPESAYKAFTNYVHSNGYYEAYEMISEVPGNFGVVQNQSAVFELTNQLRAFESINDQASNYIHSLFDQNRKEKLIDRREQLRSTFLDTISQISTVKRQSGKAAARLLAQTEEGRDLLKLNREVQRGVRVVQAVISFHRSLQRLSNGKGPSVSKQLMKSIGIPSSAIALKSVESCSKMLLREAENNRSQGLTR
ncbi:relaxase/mobilization nuclease domain-containing protein [Rhodohalobacter sp. 614A]|uniref:relaxase/mobilization nuclease domain-containing protein n=1 Tax=Rhodohalobacter sp. 614A TaxID=2908649 RepID=UPI001F28A521|nr:relaxase/mobilization nuclease domain-containing protein [Rhodohalobacter sp. 614A]